MPRGLVLSKDRTRAAPCSISRLLWEQLQYATVKSNLEFHETDCSRCLQADPLALGEVREFELEDRQTHKDQVTLYYDIRLVTLLHASCRLPTSQRQRLK